MMNIGRVLDNPKFRQSFTVYRKSGQFGAGGYQETETSLPMSGVVTPTTSRDIQQVPEGDRVTESMTFYTKDSLYITHTDGTAGTSDQAVYRGARYKIVQVKNYLDYGYNKAIGMRMSGA